MENEDVIQGCVQEKFRNLPNTIESYTSRMRNLVLL